MGKSLFEVILVKVSQYFWCDPKYYGNGTDKNCLFSLILIAVDILHTNAVVSAPKIFHL